MRNVFDHWLNQLAIEAGADFRSECTYQHFRRDGQTIVATYTTADGESHEVCCKYLVDASGLSSLPVRRSLRPDDFSDAMFAWIYNKTLDDGNDYWCVGTSCTDGTIEERQARFYEYVAEKFKMRGDIKPREHFSANINYASTDRVWLGEGNLYASCARGYKAGKNLGGAATSFCSQVVRQRACLL